MSSAPPIASIPTLSTLPLVVESPRVRLRPPAETDAEALFPLVSNPDLPKYMSWAPHATIDDTRAWLRSGAEEIAGGEQMTWMIEHAGAPVGCIGLDGIKWSMAALRVDRAELGYWIAPAFWGKGLMTEAATLATRWGFETLGLHKITVSCFEPNVASKRVIEKVGFRYYGRQEDDVYRDGRWYAHLRYELTAAEWADSSRTLRFARPQ
jgi:ribosomal-protein-alanine N-acetyltransferase